MRPQRAIGPTSRSSAAAWWSNSTSVRTFVFGAVVLVGCAHARLDTDGTVEVPAGPFWSGSDLQERARAMDRRTHTTLVESADALERLGAESSLHVVTLDAFHIMRLPVTHADYHRFVLATGAPEPWIDPQIWSSVDAGFSYATVARHAWTDGAPAATRATHPVVLVDHAHAQAYCAWWGEQHGGRGDLPTELQWEKAARGADMRAYPWGDAFERTRANTLESRHADTLPAGAYPRSASPFGVEDMAGNVFEWTRTRTQDGTFVVKGGSWSSDAGSARIAARHARPAGLRHVAIGFRCVLEPAK